MNSKSRRSLALMAVLLALPAQAQEPKPDPKPAPPKPAPAAPAAVSRSAASKVEMALESVSKKVLAGDADRAVYEEAVGAINSSFDNLQQSTPSTQSVRTRMIAVLDDIYARAEKKAKIAPEEFTALRVDVIDANLHGVLAKAATQPGEDAMKAVESGLKQLADVSAEVDPGTAEWRNRAQTLVDELKKKPAAGAADYEPLLGELAHARAMRAESMLEKRATSKSASPTDFARARNYTADMLELQSRSDPEARELQKKLVSSIDELEQRAAQSPLTRADFESLRKELAQRGRTALAEKQKPHG
jgi:hypothetical protein